MVMTTVIENHGNGQRRTTPTTRKRLKCPGEGGNDERSPGKFPGHERGNLKHDTDKDDKRGSCHRGEVGDVVLRVCALAICASPGQRLVGSVNSPYQWSWHPLLSEVVRDARKKTMTSAINLWISRDINHIKCKLKQLRRCKNIRPKTFDDYKNL